MRLATWPIPVSQRSACASRKNVGGPHPVGFQLMEPRPVRVRKRRPPAGQLAALEDVAEVRVEIRQQLTRVGPAVVDVAIDQRRPVCHAAAAPASSLEPISAAARTHAGPSSVSRPRGMRYAGPDTLTAATQRPAPSNTGAATPFSPASKS